MKKFIVSVLILMMIFALGACAGQTAEEPESISTPVTEDPATMEDDEGGDRFSKIKIGVGLAGEGAFYEQLKLDIKNQCDNMNYEPYIQTANSAEQQNQQIRDMLSKGVSAIVLDPVDVDSLESVLAECETQHVPVINIIDSINGIVSTLISPDFINIGKSAGRDAVELFGDSTGACLMLKTDYDSFNMQLMTDGFNQTIAKDKDVSLVSEQYVGDDEEDAYETVKAELVKQDLNINFIFAQSDALGKGALRAIKESNKDVKLVVFGGDMEIIDAAVKGKVHSAIFFGPAALASDAVFIADRFIKNENYSPPQFKELRIEAAQGEDAPQYYNEDAVYARIIGE